MTVEMIVMTTTMAVPSAQAPTAPLRQRQRSHSLALVVAARLQEAASAAAAAAAAAVAAVPAATAVLAKVVPRAPLPVPRAQLAQALVVVWELAPGAARSMAPQAGTLAAWAATTSLLAAAWANRGAATRALTAPVLRRPPLTYQELLASRS